jgi:hypothetical protein
MLQNPYTREFYNNLASRYPLDGADMSYSEWIVKNTKLGGKPFSFKGYEFQKTILDDMSREMDVIKPSQVGMTEGQARKFLAFLVRNRNTAGIFTLPNEKMFKKLSKARIRPLVSQTKAFNQNFGDETPVRSMDMYEVGGSFAYFTGLTEGDATSTPADVLFHDELDLSDQSMIALFQSRLQNSDWRITQKFSTPTHPGFGIDMGYSVSDQHEYLLRCQCCGHHQIPEFDEKFIVIPGFKYDKPLTDLDETDGATYDFDAAFVKCEKCDRALDMTDPELREWVARYPSRRRRGYAITPFCTPRRNVTMILDQLQTYRNNENMRGFHNTVLGKAWSDGSNQLSDAQIKEVMGSPNQEPISEGVPVSVGIDVGRLCYVVVAPIKGQFTFPARFIVCRDAELVDTVKDILKNYNVVTGAIDRHPYTPLAEAVFEASDGVIVPTEYRGTKTVNLVRDQFKLLSHAQANRTQLLDAVARMVRKKLTKLSGYEGRRDIIFEHLKDMVRIEVDEQPARWEKLTGNDHFFHAMGFAQFALKIKEVMDFEKEDDEGDDQMFGVFGIQGQKSTTKFGMKEITHGVQHPTSLR